MSPKVSKLCIWVIVYSKAIASLVPIIASIWNYCSWYGLFCIKQHFMLTDDHKHTISSSFSIQGKTIFKKAPMEIMTLELLGPLSPLNHDTPNKRNLLWKWHRWSKMDKILNQPLPTSSQEENKLILNQSKTWEIVRTKDGVRKMCGENKC